MSKKQSIVVISLVKAEYIALKNAIKEVVWFCTLLQKLDYLQTTATIIHADNQEYIILANNLVSHSHAKYINI